MLNKNDLFLSLIDRGFKHQRVLEFLDDFTEHEDYETFLTQKHKDFISLKYDDLISIENFGYSLKEARVLLNSDIEMDKKYPSVHFTNCDSFYNSIEKIDIDNLEVFSQTYSKTWLINNIIDNTIIRIKPHFTSWEYELERAYYCIAKTGKNYYLSKNEQNIRLIADYLNGERFQSTPDIELKFALLEAQKERQKLIDITFLDVADRLSLLSKCCSRKVCALATNNERIIGTGLNGSIANSLNCCDVFKNYKPETDRPAHREWSAKNEIHAEESLIADMAATGREGLKDSTIYVNLQPCPKCSLLLTRTGTKRIVFRHKYDFSDTTFSLDIFKRSNITFEHLPQ